MKLADPLYADFSDQAKEVIQFANEEAKRLHHEYIGTEHMLLALVNHEECVANRVLRNLDDEILSKIRHDLEIAIQPSSIRSIAENRPLTSKARHAIVSAIEEARLLKLKSVGTEHLLLGLFYPFEGEQTLAGNILSNLNVRMEGVRREILKLLGQ